MAFDCLVLCDELEALRVLCKALDDAEINRDICTDVEEATSLLNHRKYEAVIVDCEGIEGGTFFLENIRRSASNKRVSVFAVISGENGVPTSFDRGATFALTKPLSYEAVARSLRVAHNPMGQERRRSFRHPAEIAVELKRNGSGTLHCVSSNISDGGMGLHGANALQMRQEFEIRFRLPEGEHWLQGHCTVRWTDRAGNAGVRFVQLPTYDYRLLKEWISEQYEKTPPSLLVDIVKKKKV
jgi:DNA-binding response OmpR family regulator